METSALTLFIATFFLVSATPGMCMTLSMSLGMTIGLRRTLWMMGGELVGVGMVVIFAVIGVATFMLQYPDFFQIFKYMGGAYLGYLGLQLWTSKGRLAISHGETEAPRASPAELAYQGFITAIANPKGWAFFIALLPPFIDQQLPLAPQMSILLSLILIIEFICLILYAAGGKVLSHLLQKRANVKLINRLAGLLMLCVGLWLVLG
ncbi:MAG: LysE family translocator [Chromatiales bacterium]|nr:LysE family translocator [Chromatiales bacterium]